VVKEGGFVYPIVSGVGSIEKLNEDLYDGFEIEFDLEPSSRPSFEMKNDFSVETWRKFIIVTWIGIESLYI